MQIMNNDPFRNRHKRTLRRIHFHHQGGKCFYCDAELHLDNHSDPAYATLEHVIPRCYGGLNHVWNTVVVCRLCNQNRDSRPLGVGHLVSLYRYSQCTQFGLIVRFNILHLASSMVSLVFNRTSRREPRLDPATLRVTVVEV